MMQDKEFESKSYHRNQMQRENILDRLKEKGCRITKQRLMLLDIILEEECSCCKEIFYKASKLDNKIGTATVYRMINTLEEIGAISRKNMYKISCDEACGSNGMCTIEFKDNTAIEMSVSKLNNILQKALREHGYALDKEIKRIIANTCEFA